jgi:hypothetical protein
MLAVLFARRHVAKGHDVKVLSDLFGHGNRKKHFYCSCGKEWVG